MRIHIHKARGRWELLVECSIDGASVDARSDHADAREAAAEAAGLLRTWSSDVDGAKPLASLWIVFGRSMKMDDFALCVSATSRIGAVREAAKKLGHSWQVSLDDHDDLHVVVNGRDEKVYPVEDGWEQGDPDWFWDVGVAPAEIGVDLDVEETWEWTEEEVEEEEVTTCSHD
jgi:hypothetical protein